MVPSLNLITQFSTASAQCLLPSKRKLENAIQICFLSLEHYMYIQQSDGEAHVVKG